MKISDLAVGQVGFSKVEAFVADEKGCAYLVPAARVVDKLSDPMVLSVKRLADGWEIDLNHTAKYACCTNYRLHPAGFKPEDHFRVTELKMLKDW